MDHAGNMIQRVGKVKMRCFLGFFQLHYNKEDKQMQKTNYEAAIELLKFKAMTQMCEGKTTCTLSEKDVNEILYVAGSGVITPESFKKKELEVI